MKLTPRQQYLSVLVCKPDIPIHVAHVYIDYVSERLIGTHTHTYTRTHTHTHSLSFYSLIASDRMYCKMFLSFKLMLVARRFQITIYERKM